MGFARMGAGFGRMLNPLGGSGIPSWVLPGATVSMDVANNRYYGGTQASLISIARASSKTNLLPSSASGFAYSTFLSNVLAVTPTLGALIETSAATNLFLNSTAPVTQTINLATTGSYTLWVNGSGSAAIAANTATITGAGTSTNGTPVTVNCTVAGTVDITITGSLNAVQLEKSAFGTSFVVTAGVSATRAADTVTLIGAADTIIQSNVFSLVMAVGGSPNTNPHLLRDNTANYDLKFNGVPSQTGIVAVANAQTLSGGLGSGSIGSAAKFGFAIGAGGGSLVGNNGTLITNASAVWAGTSPNNLLFGYMGYLSKLDLFPSKIADATLKGYTV